MEKSNKITDLKLVICDIDGTLVDDDRKVSEHTINVIKTLQEHGVLFGLASGRPVRDLQPLKEKWGLEKDFDVYIGMNGSELYDSVKDEFNNYHLMKKEWLKEVVELLEPFHLNPFIYYEDVLLTSKADEETMASAKRGDKLMVVADDISALWAQENAKILFRISEDLMPEVEAYANAHPSEYYACFKTQSTMLEFADRRVAKGYALKEYCEANGLKPENVIAFGDMNNDDSMLIYSGLGVCLLNGGEATKAIADDITEYTNNEDGFARYMQKHFLDRYGW